MRGALSWRPRGEPSGRRRSSSGKSRSQMIDRADGGASIKCSRRPAHLPSARLAGRLGVSARAERPFCINYWSRFADQIGRPDWGRIDLEPARDQKSRWFLAPTYLAGAAAAPNQPPDQSKQVRRWSGRRGDIFCRAEGATPGALGAMRGQLKQRHINHDPANESRRRSPGGSGRPQLAQSGRWTNRANLRANQSILLLNCSRSFEPKVSQKAAS